MATIEEIGRLLDEQLSPLRKDFTRMSEDVTQMSGNFTRMSEGVTQMSGNFTRMSEDVTRMTGDVDFLTRRLMRKEAREMFGASFSKRFLIRSLHDAVHLLTKAMFDGLTLSAIDERLDAAIKLADKAKTLAIPLAQAFLESFTSKYGESVPWAEIESAKGAYENRDFNKGLGILVRLAKTMDSVPNNVARSMERLKKAFSRWS